MYIILYYSTNTLYYLCIIRLKFICILENILRITFEILINFNKPYTTLRNKYYDIKIIFYLMIEMRDHIYQ